MKKAAIIILCVGFVLIFLILSILIIVFPESHSNGFQDLKEEREHIVDMIKNGEVSVKSNGLIILPEDLKHLSQTGECFLVSFREETAIYFYSFRGVIDSSKGYLFITDQLDYEDYIDLETYVAEWSFVNVEEIEENWYSCATD